MNLIKFAPANDDDLDKSNRIVFIMQSRRTDENNSHFARDE